MSNERLGWRDLGISKRHREWGALGASDIDFTLVESDKCTPLGIFEYKHENVGTPNMKDYGINVNRKLANAAKIPFFVVVYKENLTEFKVYSANKRAAKYFDTDIMDEHTFVKFLYHLRGKKIPADIAKKCYPYKKDNIRPAKLEPINNTNNGITLDNFSE